VKRQTKVRLCLAILVLVSVLGLGLTGSEATAAACCEQCDNLYQGCLAGTLYKGCGGDPMCCLNRVEWCYPGCYYC
jgi:hypothetical protein